MNTLILTRGVPGCGKSTWVDIMGYKTYTLCPDNIRLMYCAPEMKADGTFGISQKADKYVWEFVFKVLEQRMKLGCLTVIDATHTKESAINAYKKLCEKYNYVCYVKDFSDVPLETCKNRNKHRMGCFKFVPEEVIERMYENLTSSKIPSWCKSFKEIEDDVTLVSGMKQVKADNYDEVFFIGDIHGCYNPLEKFFKEHPFKETNLYVFVGDYIDRGTQNKEVLEFLIKHSYSHKNCIFLRGNHEKWLDLYSKGFIEEIKSKQFLDHTMKEIKGISKVAIKDFTDKLETLEKAQETLQNKMKVVQDDTLLVNSDAKLRLTKDVYGVSSMATSNNEDTDKVYTIVGKYPKYQVVKKLIKAEDENNYCLEDISLSTGPILSMHPKNMCFKKYEEAFNKVLQLIQEKSSKNYIKKGK